jgi:hypothetical protein
VQHRLSFEPRLRGFSLFGFSLFTLALAGVSDPFQPIHRPLPRMTSFLG